MALRFPDKKVALDIVVGKAPEPEVIERNGWKIIRVTYDQMEDYQTCKDIMHLIAKLIGSDAPLRADWEENTHLVNEAMLARSA